MDNNHEWLAVLKGIRNGLVYGAKIRFPHALVMTFLFRDGDLSSKLFWILQATKQHALNLGKFVGIFKLIMLLLRKYSLLDFGANGNPFLAGLIGGYVVFGGNDPINNQIVMYLFSRVIHGIINVILEKYAAVGEKGAVSKYFPGEAAVVWALVMWLFYNHRNSLQSSLQASMQYLYLDSDHFDSLTTLLWKNK